MSRKINIKKLSGQDPEPTSKKLLNSGKEENQNKSSAEEIFCPVLKHKIHCSQLEGTEASNLPEERRYEFCLNKCPVIRVRNQILRKMDEFKIVYQERILKVARCLTEKGCKYKIKITNGFLSRSWEEYFNNDEEALESARRNFGDFYQKEVT